MGSRATDRLEALASRARSFTSDSRTAGPGAIFVALRGERRDGHDFVTDALARGGFAVVETGAVARLDLAAEERSGFVVETEDVHAAHRVLAAIFRRRFSGTVVAVGGSSGKTTAKEFLRAMLEARFRTVATERSQNGERGIPKTLEKLEDGVEMAVVEIGIDAPGDMERHAGIVHPDVAVLTSIGEEHLNLLGSIERVFREETVLFDVAISRGGACFAPAEDRWLASLRGRERVTLVPSEPEAVHPDFATGLRNPYARRNAALAAAVALHVGVAPGAIAPVLSGLVPPDGRGGERRLPSGALLLLDHYNANPSSMRAGLEAARWRADEERCELRLVLGDMLDLGAATRSAHEGLLPAIGAVRPEAVWLVGPEMSRLEGALRGACPTVRSFQDSAHAAGAAVEMASRPGVVLFKASRGTALERILDAID